MSCFQCLLADYQCITNTVTIVSEASKDLFADLFTSRSLKKLLFTDPEEGKGAGLIVPALFCLDVLYITTIFAFPAVRLP